MLDSCNYKFKLGSTEEIPLKLPEGVFIPTGTSATLIKAVRAYVKKPGKMLDLGSGCGVVGVVLNLEGLVEAPLYASDLSQQAVDCMKENATSHQCSVVAKCGSLFEPWENETFDYIVNDISGVAVEVAKLSPWFDHVPCESGADGAVLVVQVLQKASAHLKNGGRFFFPVISLSNVDKILTEARRNFSNVECLCREQWPLPQEMQKHLETLKRLRDEGHIRFEEKFGMALWFTDIYVAYNS
jgi:precorrin-6B methylase 2